MALANFTDEEVTKVLHDNLTPSDFIRTPERLFGREQALKSINRAFSSAGRQVFIYGDRGVGKTSLALTAAHLHTHASLTPIHVNCATKGGFSEIMQAIGNYSIPIAERIEKAGNRGTFGVSIPQFFGVNYTLGQTPTTTLPSVQTLNDALDVIRYVAHRTNGQSIVIVIDEMERLKTNEDREMFAEFIKNSSQASSSVRFIYCGIGSDLTELIGAHPSAGRVLEPLELKKLSADALWKIIEKSADTLSVTIDREKLIRTVQISDGFPHFVHLIGESLFWVMFDDPHIVATVSHEHFRAAIAKALTRTEAVLRHQYDKATKKTKNTEEYEEALWALADKTSDRRQLSDIYEVSYSRIMTHRGSRPRQPKETLNKRLLALKSDSHGRIVVGHGSGWFSFRENIMRGYVRLDAEHRGIQLGRDVAQ